MSSVHKNSQRIANRVQFAKLAVAVCAVCVAGGAQAQYYGGLSLNQPEAKSPSTLFGFSGGETPSELIALDRFTAFTPAKPTGLNLSDQPSLGIKLGYRFNSYFSVEGRYIDRAPTTLDRTVFGRSLSGRDVNNVAQREKSLGLDLVGTLPLMNALSLQGRAGVRSELVDRSDVLNIGASRLFTPVTAGVVGIGLHYNFNRSLGLRFDAERIRKYSSDRFAGEPDYASNVSLGVLWRF
jgi:OmpA-OmpF porin, OOP family